MKILFVHQNFPGQFKHLAPSLAAQGHEVLALMIKPDAPPEWQGVKLISYIPNRNSTPNIHPWLIDFETKTIRAEAAFYQANQLKKAGFYPDIIFSNPGWGESLFLKEVWPRAKLAVYCEFFYHPMGYDLGFDPEFTKEEEAVACRIRFKNLNLSLHFEIADAGLSPTHWQASSCPDSFRSRITVIHDGIDTDVLAPNAKANLILSNNKTLSRSDEIITFVNRNLEPYRGYHSFMRSLPEILERRPQAKVLIVGGDGVSYGAAPPNNLSWRDIFFSEIKDKLSLQCLDRIYFLGRIPYPYFVALLQISTVHIYLTYPFVLSWSLLEAMSCGCAIVASNTAPILEVIEHNKTGKLVNFFNYSEIAETVCQLLAHPKERKRLGKAARQFALRHYDLKTICLPQQLEWLQKL